MSSEHTFAHQKFKNAIIVDEGLKKSVSALKAQRKEKLGALKDLEDDDPGRTDHETALIKIDAQITQLGKQPYGIFKSC